MYTRSLFAALLSLVVSLSLLVGCESKETPTPTTTIAPPPPVDGAPPAVASVEHGGPQTTVTGETLSTFNPGGNESADGDSTAKVAPADTLAPYAAALAIVQPDHFAVIKFDMAALRNSAFMQSLPVDAEQMAKQLPVPGGPDGKAKEMAAQLTSVESIWISLGPPRGNDGDVPLSVGAFIRCASPQAAQDALAPLGVDAEHAERVELQGGEYFRQAAFGGRYWAVRGADIYMSYDENVVRSAVAAGGKIADTELLKKLAGAKLDAPLVIAGSFGPFKMTLTQSAINAIKQSPIPLSPELGKLPSQIQWAVIAIDPDAEAMIDINADLDAEQSAENFKTSLDGLVSLGKIMLGQQAAAAKEAGAADPETLQALGIVKAALDAVAVNHQGQHVNASFNRFAELADVPALMNVLLERGRAVQAMNSGRMLGLAAHMYRDTTRNWPDDVKGDDGTVLLSWRYLLLPYLENKSLYEQISRDQAWDGATNQQFAAQMPEFFASPSASEPNTTTWKMLQGHPSDIQFLDAGQGTETPWLKPDGFTIDPLNPQLSLGDEPAGGYIVVNRDGSVERLNRAALLEKLSGKIVGEDPPVAEIAPAGDDPLAGEPAAPNPLADQEPRTWTSGRAKIKAVLLGVEGDKVKLRRIDTEREFIVPLAKLSEEDQAYVRSLNLGM